MHPPSTTIAPWPLPPKPSALMTATLRAAHQLYDAPLVLEDALALRIIGPGDEAELIQQGEKLRHPLLIAMRTTMVVRARLAEDSLDDAPRLGVRQLVILGAGLDTYAYRAKPQAGVRLYEVDLPATRQWKRACLQAAGIATPEALRHVGADFNQGRWLEDLRQAGYQQRAAACFSWLGVSMYLQPEAVLTVLRQVAACAPGSSIVFDYRMPMSHLTPPERAGMEAVSSALAAQGEHLHSAFEPAALELLLRQAGFSAVEHFDADALTQRYLANRDDGLRMSGIFRMIRATV